MSLPMATRTHTLSRSIALVLFSLTTPLAAQKPDAHWSFDGATLPERLAESYARSELKATEQGGSSTWNKRSGFGDVLANGNNPQYLSVSSSEVDPGSSDFSLSIWSYRISGSGSTAGIIDALSSSAASGFQWFYQADNTLRIRLDDDANHSVICDTSDAQLALNTWQNLILTVDRSAARLRFYVDGAEVAPIGGVNISSLTGSLTPDQDFSIGNFNTTAAKGQLDDLAIFKRVLSPADIVAINANSGTPILTVWPSATAPPSVIFDPPAGILRDGETVTLTSDPGGQPIRFTTDGSEPDENSTLYSAPISLAASGEIRARAYNDPSPGPVASANYLRLPDTPPNILLIVADDLGFNDLGCYGAVSVATPRLDALAHSGQRFTQFTTTGPGDLANQYALLTGRLARRGGLPAVIPEGFPGLDTREWTLAETLRKQGYETGFVGAWHLGDPAGSRPEDQGFRSVHRLPADLATLTAQARDFLTAHASDSFFLLFQAPAEAATGSSLLGSYGNQVEALDSSVGSLLDELDTLGIADDTLVIFLSDSGAERNSGTFPTGSNGQMKDGKGTTWEGGVHVPAIARWPGVIAPGDNFATLWLPDLFSSLVDISDSYLATDRPLDGSIRSNVLLGMKTKPDANSTLFLHRHNGSDYELRAVRSGRWKLHQAYNNSDPENKTSSPAPLLYDLLVDPIEHVNRSGTHSSTLAALQQLAATHEATFATPIPQLPPAKPPVIGEIDTSITPPPPGRGTVSYTFTRPADSLDDYYPLEHSSDLATWTELPSAPFVTSSEIHPNGNESVIVEIPLDHPDFTPPSHFIRLKAKRP